MTNRERGFTLIELMIVIAIIAIIAAIALPNLLSARLTANESAAIATLNNIASAQSQCMSSGAIDVNGNGSGEYGFFAELSGFAPVRGGLQRIAPPVLSSAFANVTARRVTRSGYIFQMYLPGVAADGIAEDPLGGDIDNGNGVEPSLAETLWCCYAWPLAHGSTGRRTFFVNQAGDVLTSYAQAAPYNGATTPPSYEAAFLAGEPARLDARIAANSVGQDGNTWVVVN
jgi:prepilin-type N-terminal cleavage/methylation domain-containing protein